MTLFSGTFFPVDRLPGWVQPLAWVSPLWHGTELARSAALRPRGRRWPALGHLAFLLVLLGGRRGAGRPAASPGGWPDDRARPARRCRSRRVAGGCCRPAATPGGRGRCCCARPPRRGGPGWRSCPGSSSRCSTWSRWARGSARWSARCPGRTAPRSATRRSSRPGLLAASAMNGAVFDSTYNVFFKLKYSRLYDAMLATPLGPVDIALGEIGWALIRGGLYALGFLTVMAGFGLLGSPWALLALPAALLVAFAFAAVGHGRHVVHALLAGLRPGHAGDPADVPVLHHLLPAVGLPAVAAGRRRVPAALPRRRADARAHHRRGAPRPARPPGVLPGHDRRRAGVVAARRLDALLLR